MLFNNIEELKEEINRVSAFICTPGFWDGEDYFYGEEPIISFPPSNFEENLEENYLENDFTVLPFSNIL
jgi:hypothetical protein